MLPLMGEGGSHGEAAVDAVVLGRTAKELRINVHRK